MPRSSTQAAAAYYRLGRRRGLTRDYAAAEMRRNGTLIGAMLVREGQRRRHAVRHVRPLRLAPEIRRRGDRPARGRATSFAAMHLLMLPQQTVFICDTYINPDPTAEQLADIALLAAEEVRRFGLEPRLALLSHSSFGSADTPSARKMREALALIQERAPELEVEGEMHADAALSQARARPGVARIRA